MYPTIVPPFPAGSPASPPRVALPAPPAPALPRAASTPSMPPSPAQPRAASTFPESPHATLLASPTPAQPRVSLTFPESPHATLSAPPSPHSHVRPRRPLRLPHSLVQHWRSLRSLATPSPSRHTSVVVDAVHRLVPTPRFQPTTPSLSTVILDTST
jgi:hypothetical protein